MNVVFFVIEKVQRESFPHLELELFIFLLMLFIFSYKIFKILS